MYVLWSSLPLLLGATQLVVADRDWTAPTYAPNAERADAVKQTFQIAWDGYYKWAFPHDSLRPVNNTFYDDRNGWGASPVDALSTALVHGNMDVVKTILKFVPTIDFDHPKTNSTISLFETTIRYLGGLLSAYDLIRGPLSDKVSVDDDELVSTLLKQARHLADNLKVAFSTPSGVPDNELLFSPPRKNGSVDNGIATIGTLVLEWTRLSDLTGDPSYGRLAQGGEDYLLKPRNPEVGEPWPGLIGTGVYLANGTFEDGDGGWVAGDDSFYEYLIKMYLYDPNRFGLYKDRWVQAVDSTIKNLKSHPSTRPDLTFLAAYLGNKTLIYESQHLACFAGGNIILGGLTLQKQEYVDFGLDLVEGCHETYIQTATGIGPEIFRWQDNSTTATVDPYWNPAPNATLGQDVFYQKAGFWITSSAYILRPEVLESIYYAYRATGDKKYQEWAWDAYLKINSTCHIGSGYTDIKNVNAPRGGANYNFQETFFFAETLKYAYLIHAPEADWQVKADRTNQFVFNTEAHPMRIATGSEKPPSR